MEILAIPLSRTNTRDTLVWEKKKNSANIFTVKTAYRVALRLNERSQIEYSRAISDRTTWKKIWALKVPPKVRIFEWCACCNILLTREILHRRKVMVDPWREICCQKSVSVGHILWECPLATNAWVICRGKIQKCPNDARELFALFRMHVDRLPQLELERWAIISWAI